MTVQHSQSDSLYNTVEEHVHDNKDYDMTAITLIILSKKGRRACPR